MLSCEDGLGGTAADGKPFYISMNNLKSTTEKQDFKYLRLNTNSAKDVNDQMSSH